MLDLITPSMARDPEVREFWAAAERVELRVATFFFV
jgi:hypothetical protein